MQVVKYSPAPGEVLRGPALTPCLRPRASRGYEPDHGIEGDAGPEAGLHPLGVVIAPPVRAPPKGHAHTPVQEFRQRPRFVHSVLAPVEPLCAFPICSHERRGQCLASRISGMRRPAKSGTP
jgi:hypothetical protein